MTSSSPINLALTPEPPYYAVIFSSLRTPGNHGDEDMAAPMLELAARPPRFFGVDSARGADGLGITVSYWRDLAAISAWKAVSEHQQAQALGRADWYSAYQVRIARVEKTYGFDS